MAPDTPKQAQPVRTARRGSRGWRRPGGRTTNGRTLHRQYNEWKRLAREQVAAEEKLSAQPEPILTAVGGGESHLSSEAIAARRTREHHAATSAIRAEVDRIRSQHAEAHEQCVVLRAVLAEEFELACEVSERLRWYYARRLATHNRSLEATRAATAGTALPAAWQLSATPWATKPCPWIPKGLDADLATKEDLDVR